MYDSYELNPYYHPENRGLEIVAELELLGHYEFDTTVVWRRLSDGALLWASDSGCSCPVPFEGYTDDGSLERLSNWKYFEDTVRSRCEGYSYSGDRESFLREVRTIFDGE